MYDENAQQLLAKLEHESNTAQTPAASETDLETGQGASGRG